MKSWQMGQNILHQFCQFLQLRLRP